LANPSPIAVFIYKRAAHLEATLQSLRLCDGFDESPLIVFADGPRDRGEADAVNAARTVARDLLGPRAEYRFSDANLGLGASIIRGVTDVVGRFGRGIILEDDLQLAPHFLTYMNQGLDRYEHRTEVFQVAGHMFDTPEFEDRQSVVFLPFTTTWGWGTWRRAWDRFDPLAAGWRSLRNDRALRADFNLGGAYDYSTMLERQMSGTGDSWGIRWYWSVFRARGLVCFPPGSLVHNAGIDGSGTHGRGILRGFGRSHPSLDRRRIDLVDDPSLVPADFEAVRKAIRRQNGGWIGASSDQLRDRLRNFPSRFRS
jgi:hypothetical protein